MKGIFTIFMLACLCPHLGQTGSSLCFTSLFQEYRQRCEKRNQWIQFITEELNLIYESVEDPDETIEERFNSLLEYQNLKTHISLLKDEYDYSDVLFRYEQGIEILKMLYEKILGLDHHFSTLRTFQEIQEISNPNSYPSFSKAKEHFKSSTKTKSSVELPSFLEKNPFVSLGYTLIASVFGEGNKAERTKEISDIACLLDFTVSMYSDIKIIYYETDFLRASNRELKLRCQELFKSYTQIINYNKSLDYCRNHDDWANLKKALDLMVLEGDHKLSIQIPSEHLNLKDRAKSLEFSVNRLVNFMDSYDDFVHQGEHYYQKFRTIINSYQNKNLCQQELPHQLSELEKEINVSIDKFKTAYNLAELHGSKLRDLLFGSIENI